MAADGSLNFDTKVNTEGFDAGMSTLTKAAEKLTGVMEALTSKMEGGFSGGATAASNTAKGVDQISDSAKAAAAELERLQKEKDAVFTGTITNNNAPTPTAAPDDGKRYDIYGNDVDAMIAKNKELAATAQQTAAAVEQETAKEQQSMVSLKDSLINALDVFKRLPGGISDLFKQATGAMTGAETKARNLQDEIDQYADALYYAEQKGFGLGDKSYDDAYVGLTKAKQAAEKYKKSLLGLDNNQKKADKSAKKMTGSLKNMKKTAAPLTKSILKLSNMLKLMLIRMAMHAAVQAAKEGFENLAQYSGETNKSISMLMSAMTRLKNSFATAFAPIVNAAAPALKGLIDLLSEGATMAGQFLAALTGKSTFVKAVNVEEDYGESLKKNNKELKKREKENKKLAFSFDDLIQAQKQTKQVDDPDGYKPPTPDQMFETVTVENDIKSFADKVKEILSGLFTPLKQSWIDNGAYVTGAVQAAFASIKNLAVDVGASFMQVWDKEGYGKQITDDLLISFGNLALTVKNLADRFDEAWKKGDIGTSIIRHLGDIVLIFTGFLRDATEAIKDWAGKLDFYPLLKSFDSVLAKLRPIIQKISDALLWLLKNVLLPLTKWGIENGLPAVFDLISGALEVFNSVLDALQPLAMWLWDTFLQPLGKWTGKVIIGALKEVTKWLTKFSDWISQHQEEVRTITVAVAGFFAAWEAIEFVNKVKNIIGALSSKGGLIGVLKSLIGNLDKTKLGYMGIATAIGILIGAIYDIYKNWDKMTVPEKIIASVLALASAAAILAVSLASVGGPGKVALIVGAIVAGVAASAIAVNAGKRAGSSSRSSYSPYSSYSLNGSAYRVPHLATGTVVPPRAGEFAAILGDNNRETEVVSPISAMKQAFKEAIQEMGGLGNNQTVKADLILDGTRFGQLVYQYGGKEKQRIGVRMVTEG